MISHVLQNRLKFEDEKFGVSMRFKSREAVLELAAELVNNASEVTWPRSND